MKNAHEFSDTSRLWDFTELLHPKAFGHPDQVVHDPGLSLNEKRAILAAWVSDACAVDEVPVLRRAPGSATTVTVDELLDALQALDRQFADIPVPTARRQRRRASMESFRAERVRENSWPEERPAS